MTRPKDVPYLRLVTSKSCSPHEEQETHEHGRHWMQLPLFPDRSALLGFIHTAATTGQVFSGILRAVRPTWLLDLRPAPLFDLDYWFTRRMAFRLFDELQIEYQDIAQKLDIEDRRDARLHGGEVSQHISELLARTPEPGPRGPIVFLVDDSHVLDTAAQILPMTLAPFPKGGWHAEILARYEAPLDRKPSFL
jgi:hypothetical protein